jgi:hypothetical protein
MTAAISEGFQIVLRKPQGQVETVAIHCNRVLAGSGAHCEVRLPMEHAGVEHVELTVADGRIHARARAFDPPPTVNGTPFVQTYLEPGGWIGVGPFQIVATPIVLEDGAPAVARAKQGIRPSVAFSALLAAAIVGLGLAKAHGSARPAGPPEAPPLWAAPASSCPQALAPQALALAHQRQVLAETKRERRAFKVGEGGAAVASFETAATCYAAAGAPDDATAMSQAGATLRARVAEEYHAHQVRLEHALLVEDSPSALREVRALRAFTQNVSGPYADWLSDLDRRLQLEAAAKEHAS